jgi:hypothetical protein
MRRARTGGTGRGRRTRARPLRRPQACPIVDGPLSDDPAVARAQQERASFSVPSDRETVEALLAGERGPLASGFTFPLLESERVEGEAQSPQGHGIDVTHEVIAYVDANPAAAAAFGLTWVDNTRGGIHVAFTDDVATHEAALRERLPAEAMPVVVEVANTYDELVAATDKVTFDGEHGVEIVGAGVMTDANRVTISVFGLDDEGRRLAERFDPSLFCVEDSVRPVPATPDG